MMVIDQIWNFIKEWYWIPLLIIYAGVILTILGENRDPAKSLAYILVLLFVPVLGLVVYYFVGRKPVFKKTVFEKKRLVDRQKLKEYYHELKPEMEERLLMLQEEIGEMSLPFRYLYNENQSLISRGNKITLLNNGEEKFPLFFKAIETASSHIHLEYYMLTADDIGSRLTDLLIRKKQEGVEVRIIVDDVGSNKIEDIPKRLKKAGISIVKTMPVAFTSLANTNYRNHRKIAVIDWKTGFIGGINLDDRYLNNGKHKLYWRDVSVKIDGAAVKLLQVQFLLSWFFSGGTDDFGKAEIYLTGGSKTEGNAIISFAASGPDTSASYVMETILIAINQARKSIKITTPYFIPTDQLVSALVIAASKGVQVDLILPEQSDSFIVQHASFSFIKPLLQRKVNVFLYRKGFLHSKTISIDGSLAFVGTVNMDTRSFFLNFEIMSVVYEPAFCDSLERSFEKDKNDSRRISLEYWKSRPVIQRGFDSICRLMAPLL